MALLAPYGNVGLVWANCLNMAARIASSAYFIAEFQADAPKAAPKLGMDNCTLHLHTLAALALGGVVTQTSLILTGGRAGGRSLKMDLVHIGVGVAMLVLVLVAMYKRQREMLVAVGVLRGGEKAE